MRFHDIESTEYGQLGQTVKAGYVRKGSGGGAGDDIEYLRVTNTGGDILQPK